MPARSMTIFSSRPGIVVTAAETSRIALIGGAPVGRRYIEWNFVSSRRERIEQAKDDWRAGRFGWGERRSAGTTASNQSLPTNMSSGSIAVTPTFGTSTS